MARVLGFRDLSRGLDTPLEALVCSHMTTVSQSYEHTNADIHGHDQNSIEIAKNGQRLCVYL